MARITLCLSNPLEIKRGDLIKVKDDWMIVRTVVNSTALTIKKLNWLEYSWYKWVRRKIT